MRSLKHGGNVTKIATRDAYGDALVALGKKRDDVVVLDADLSGSTKTSKFAKVFPDRFFNIGIAEQDMMGTAAGLAIAGKLPFASTFAVFATGRAWEQVRQSICYPNLSVKIVASHAGITVGEDGGNWEQERQRAARMAAALAKLPGVQREAVVLFELEGFGIEEIAALQRATPSAVKSRLARGRERAKPRSAVSRSGFRRWRNR